MTPFAPDRLPAIHTQLGPVPSRASGFDGGSQPPGEDLLEAGKAGSRGTTTQNVDRSSRDRQTLPVRYLSRRWLKSWSRRNSSGSKASPRPSASIGHDRPNRLPSYRFLFRAPPAQQIPRGTTLAAEDPLEEQAVPQTKDENEGPQRSLSSYFSKSPSKREEVVGVRGQSTGARPIEEEEPRRRCELPQYESKGSLASWRGAPPPEYVSTKAVGRELPPPAYVSRKDISSVTGPSSSLEVMICSFVENTASRAIAQL